MSGSDLKQRIRNAIRVKLRPDSPTLGGTLDELQSSVPYGIEAVLRTSLNSAIAGPGPQPLESGVVNGADASEKREALLLVVDELAQLRTKQIDLEKVSGLIVGLQNLAK